MLESTQEEPLLSERLSQPFPIRIHRSDIYTTGAQTDRRVPASPASRLHLQTLLMQPRKNKEKNKGLAEDGSPNQTADLVAVGVFIKFSPSEQEDWLLQII